MRVLEFDALRLIRTVFWSMVSLELFCMVLDYAVNYRRFTAIRAFRRWADITSEQSFSSWVAITQTFMVGLTLWLIVALVSRQPDAMRWRTAGWALLAAFFTYMSMDDGTRFHEGVGSAFSYVFRVDLEPGEVGSLGTAIATRFPSYYWQVVFIPFFAAVGLFMLWFIRKEIRETRPLFLGLAALAFLASAVALDFLEGLDEGHPWNVWAHFANPERDLVTQRLFGQDSYDTLVHFAQSFEETFEMFGNTLLWVIFLRYLTAGPGRDFRVRFVGGATGPSA